MPLIQQFRFILFATHPAVQGSVIVCICMYVLVKCLFWIAVWPIFWERNCPFGFLLVVFWLWCQCLMCIFFSLCSLGRKVLGNCIDSLSFPSFLFNLFATHHAVQDYHVCHLSSSLGFILFATHPTVQDVYCFLCIQQFRVYWLPLIQQFRVCPVCHLSSSLGFILFTTHPAVQGLYCLQLIKQFRVYPVCHSSNSSGVSCLPLIQ